MKFPKEREDERSDGCAFMIALFFAVSLIALVLIATTSKNRHKSHEAPVPVPLTEERKT